jgi:hypothetical protein
VSPARELLAGQVALPVYACDPPEIEGWRDELGAPRPRIGADGACSAVASRRRDDDGSIGPCPWVACRHHLLLDLGEPVTIGGRRFAAMILNRAGEHPVLGRRPGLAAVPTAGEAAEFESDALDRLDELPDSCALDVIARYGGEVPVEAVAAALGVSEEQVRLDSRAAEIETGYRTIGLVPDPATPGCYVPAPVPRPKVRRTWRGKVGAPSQAPAGPRIERDAPSVREPSAGEIFTF